MVSKHIHFLYLHEITANITLDTNITKLSPDLLSKIKLSPNLISRIKSFEQEMVITEIDFRKYAEQDFLISPRSYGGDFVTVALNHKTHKGI